MFILPSITHFWEIHSFIQTTFKGFIFLVLFCYFIFIRLISQNVSAIPYFFFCFFSCLLMNLTISHNHEYYFSWIEFNFWKQHISRLLCVWVMKIISKMVKKCRKVVDIITHIITKKYNSDTYTMNEKREEKKNIDHSFFSTVLIACLLAFNYYGNPIFFP